MNFGLSDSAVNQTARKERHQKLAALSPLFQGWARVEGTLSSQEKKLERHFLWRVAILGTLFFLILSIFPQFVITAEDFWAPPENMPAEGPIDQNVAIASEGFLIKPELVGSAGDRTGLTDIRYYTVEQGDTLSGIASRNGVTTATILQNNDIANANSLRPGQVLKIIPVNGLIYQVAKGDTLQKIASKYNVKPEAIQAQNKLKNDALQTGMNLIIPGAKKPEPPIQIAISKNAGGAKGIINKVIPAGSNAVAAVGKMFIKPTSGNFTQFFHYGHWAVDIANGMGTPIHAAAAGTVEKAAYGWNGGYGNMILINHGNGIKTLYGHMKELYAKVGDKVSQGQTIGAMGNTGHVVGRTGVHLHFEVQINGDKKNPIGYF